MPLEVVVTRARGSRLGYGAECLGLLLLPVMAVHVLVAIFAGLVTYLLGPGGAVSPVVVLGALLAAGVLSVLCVVAARNIGIVLRPHLRLLAGFHTLTALALVLWPYANATVARGGRMSAPLFFVWGLYLAYRANRRRWEGR